MAAMNLMTLLVGPKLSLPPLSQGFHLCPNLPLMQSAATEKKEAENSPVDHRHQDVEPQEIEDLQLHQIVDDHLPSDVVARSFWKAGTIVAIIVVQTNTVGMIAKSLTT